jgi:glycosyltransferase involved in cell wall biosynthesis
MRVLQVMAGAVQGGAETFFVELVSAMQRAGIEQQAVIRHHPERLARLTQAGVPLVQLPFAGRLDPFTPYRLKRLAERYQPDVAIAWMGRAAQALPRGKWINVGRLGGWYDLKRFRTCDELVCNTQGLREWCIAQGWPEARVHHIANFSTWHKAPAVRRADFSTPDDAHVMLALGRLHRNKAFDIAIRALAGLPHTWLWIAGEGDLRPELEKVARESGVLDRVRFLGWRADKEALFAAADVCLVPSREEPFGNVVLDAWASGKPLVVSDSEGPRQYVRDGIDCLKVPVDDPAALAAAVTRLRNDPALRHKLSVAGYLHWQATFTEEVAIRNWRTFFERIATACAA